VSNAFKREPTSFSWLDGVRCLELFDAVRYGVKKGKVVPMYYQDYMKNRRSRG
jgi:hypothetical protein